LTKHIPLAVQTRSVTIKLLAYAEAPARMSGGYDATILRFSLESAPDPFSGPLVLRLFQATVDAQRASCEAAVQKALADLGYPAPRVYPLSHRKVGSDKAEQDEDYADGRDVPDYRADQRDAEGVERHVRDTAPEIELRAPRGHPAVAANDVSN
jgi:hypothetical protein